MNLFVTYTIFTISHVNKVNVTKGFWFCISFYLQTDCLFQIYCVSAAVIITFFSKKCPNDKNCQKNNVFYKFFGTCGFCAGHHWEELPDVFFGNSLQVDEGSRLPPQFLHDTLWGLKYHSESCLFICDAGFILHDVAVVYIYPLGK